MLELREVTKRYRSGSEVITAADRVSLTIGSGELVALYGPSGSGKTTLLMMAAGLVLPDAGAVLVNGVNLAAFSAAERVRHRRNAVGIVSQSIQLHAGLSALDNATVKLLAEGVSPREARERALPLLDAVGLGERAHHRPRQLSTGERQRVGIARALVNEPMLVLADEPTGNLDSRRSQDVLGLLAEACKGRGVGALLVTHDPQAVDFADRVIELHDGVLRDGAPGTGMLLRAQR